MYLYSRYKRYIIAAVFVSILLFALYRLVFLSLGTRQMKVSFLDVGQGDAVLIESPTGNRLLYDGGAPGGSAEREIKRILPLFSRVHFYIASHPDADHIGGFLETLPRHSPRYYGDGHSTHLSFLFATIEDKLSSMNVSRMTLRRGARVSLGGGVEIEVLGPGEKEVGPDTNTSSVVLLIRFGKSQILLTGDLDIHGENRIVQTYGSAIDSQIFRAGHHGSRTSNGEVILKAVSPQYVVVSSGKNNSYGHPHKAAIQRMQSVGATILETSKQGTIIFTCDGLVCSLN